jgi:hypothetical protein
MDIVLAYIDPGSGSLIIQVVIASLLAVPFFMRQQISRVVRTIRGERPADPTTGTGTPGDDTAA